MITKDDFNIVDPRLKTEAWALRMVIYFSFNKQSLVWGKDVWELRNWQNSTYDITEFKQPYLHLLPPREGGTASDEDYKQNIHIDFTRLGLFEITKNILGGEIDKEEIHIDADCFDPTIVAKKEDEFAILKNKQVNQSKINELYKGIGVPAQFKVGENGEFDSNMNEFEGMGLNPDNQEDIEFFSTTFYRHNLETYATQFINQTIKMNGLNEIQKRHVNDEISLKAIAMQTYYNTSTGLPSTKYLYPERVFYTGVTTRNDLEDALSKSWEQIMTISDFLKMIGDPDLTKEDYMDLLAVSYAGSVFNQLLLFPLGVDFANNLTPPEGMCSFATFYAFTISVGYVEWKTTDRNELGRYFQKTLKTYYVCNVSIPYKLFKYGYLNVMVREGYESELSCFSIGTYRMEGKSMLEICIPYFKMIFSNWLHHQWFMKTAKPKGYAYDINSLERVASKFLASDGDYNDVLALMRTFKKSPDMLYSTGDENSESKIGGDGVPYQEKANGIDPSAIKFLEAIQWYKQQIIEETGLNNARIAQTPRQDEPNRTTQLVYNQSENATEYINSALSSLYSGCGYRIFYIIQAVSEFDLFGVEQLKKIFSDKYVWAVKFMKKIPIQYYGITVRRFLRDREREDIKALTMQAVVNKEIPAEIAIIINNVDDWQKAGAVLSYYKERTRKQLMQEQLKIQQAQQQTIAMEHQNKMQQIQTQGQIDLAIEQEITKRTLAEAELVSNKKIEQQAQRLSQQPGLNEQKNELEKERETHIAALDATKQILTKDNAPSQG